MKVETCEKICENCKYYDFNVIFNLKECWYEKHFYPAKTHSCEHFKERENVSRSR